MPEVFHADSWSRALQAQVAQVVGADLEVAYQQMAQEEAREAEALEWADATVGDVADETR